MVADSSGGDHANLRLESSFVDPDSGRIQVARSGERPEHQEYAGLAYQCVEYARPNTAIW